MRGKLPRALGHRVAEGLRRVGGELLAGETTPGLARVEQPRGRGALEGEGEEAQVHRRMKRLLRGLEALDGGGEVVAVERVDALQGELPGAVAVGLGGRGGLGAHGGSGARHGEQQREHEGEGCAVGHGDVIPPNGDEPL